MEAAELARDTARLAEGSRRFHAKVAEIGGPAFIAGHLKWIWENYPVPQSASVWQFDDVVHNAMAQHRALLDALGRGDGTAAERLMSEHIERAVDERSTH